MTQPTFKELVQQLGPHLEHQPTTMHQPLPAETNMASTLMKLATLASLHYVAHLFGVGKATTGEAILEVCCALQDVLANTMVWVTKPLDVVAGF